MIWQGFYEKGQKQMKTYEIYSENDVLELVAIVKANSLEEAKEKARKLGYGKSYRVEEEWGG